MTVDSGLRAWLFVPEYAGYRYQQRWVRWGRDRRYHLAGEITCGMPSLIPAVPPVVRLGVGCERCAELVPCVGVTPEELTEIEQDYL